MNTDDGRRNKANKMGELRRITGDDLIIAILSLYYGIPTADVIRIANKAKKEQKEQNQDGLPRNAYTLPELERIATEARNTWQKKGK